MTFPNQLTNLKFYHTINLSNLNSFKLPLTLSLITKLTTSVNIKLIWTVSSNLALTLTATTRETNKRALGSRFTIYKFTPGLHGFWPGIWPIEGGRWLTFQAIFKVEYLGNFQVNHEKLWILVIWIITFYFNLKST